MRTAAQLGAVMAALGTAAFAIAADDDAAVRVACVGDGGTAGVRVYPGTESYPAQLQALLGDRFTIGNFGLAGATMVRPAVPRVWQRLDEIGAFAPNVVVIALGNNDTVSMLHAEAFDHDAQALVDGLAGLSTQPRIIVCTPTAPAPDTAGLSPARAAELRERRPRLEELRALLESVADRNVAQRVELLELFPVLDGRPDLLAAGDGVHPNAKGCRAIAERVAERIRTTRTAVAVPSDESRAAAAGWRDGGVWRDQHEAILRVCRQQACRVLLLGDSITQSWGGPGRNVWAPGQAAWTVHLAGLDAINAGISGDRTEHLLWRIGHGLDEAAAPDVVVVMIGTNNLPRDTATDVAWQPVEKVGRRMSATLSVLARRRTDGIFLSYTEVRRRRQGGNGRAQPTDGLFQRAAGASTPSSTAPGPPGHRRTSCSSACHRAASEERRHCVSRPPGSTS